MSLLFSDYIDILELQKENEWTLGKLLKIDNREFLEIDQIIAEHIDPMTRRITELIQHTKFQRKARDDMCMCFKFTILTCSQICRRTGHLLQALHVWIHHRSRETGLFLFGF